MIFLPLFSYIGVSQSQSTAAPTATVSSSFLPTFDGSQESAVATLANMDPQHPMYTYLSAVAGAPAPPLPESAPSTSSSSSSIPPPPTSQASQLSPMHTVCTSPLAPPTTSLSFTTPTAGLLVASPRLPVFAQFQQQSNSNTTSTSDSSSSLLVTAPSLPSDSQSSIPMSVIQDARSLPSMSSSTDDRSQLSLQPRDNVTGALSYLAQAPPPHPQATPMGEITSASIENLAANVASQVSSFFSQTSFATQEQSSSAILSTANLADHLAEELARAVSQLVPTSSDSRQSVVTAATCTSTVALTTASASSLTVQSRHSQPQSMQSPSPSDTLAPLLMASLQMPQGGNENGTGTGTEMSADRTGSGTHVGLELHSTESQIQQQNPTNFIASSSEMIITHPSITHQPVAATITFTPDSGETSASSIATVATLTASSTLTTTSAAETTPTNSEPASVSRTVGSPPSTSQSAGEGSSTHAIGPPSTSSNQNASSSDHPQQQHGDSEEGARGAQASTEQTQLPEIDPSFLAALPDPIRQEVLVQHEREQRRLRAQQEGALSTTISPEFLAALPLNIQEEVNYSTASSITT